MTLAQAERALDEITTRERHVMHVINLANSVTDRAESARLLRLATDMTLEAREIEQRTKRALAQPCEDRR